MRFQVRGEIESHKARFQVRHQAESETDAVLASVFELIKGGGWAPAPPVPELWDPGGREPATGLLRSEMLTASQRLAP